MAGISIHFVMARSTITAWVGGTFVAVYFASIGIEKSEKSQNLEKRSRSEFKLNQQLKKERKMVSKHRNVQVRGYKGRLDQPVE